MQVEVSSVQRGTLGQTLSSPKSPMSGLIVVAYRSGPNLPKPMVKLDTYCNKGRCCACVL